MVPRICLVVIVVLLITDKKTNSYKTFAEVRGNLKKLENNNLTTTDKLVGKAMDFVYSNKTIMNLIARELWNVGSIAIDKIVKIKEGPECDTRQPNIKDDVDTVRRDYRPSKWLANSAMDVWYGNKSVIDVFSREFTDILYKLTMRPVRSLHENEDNMPAKFDGSPQPHRKRIMESYEPLEENIKMNRTLINDTIFDLLM